MDAIVKERPKGDEGSANPGSAIVWNAYKCGETRLICFIATHEGGGDIDLRVFVHDPLGYTEPIADCGDSVLRLYR